MKVWQLLSMGAAAVVLGGCAGYTAYVADAAGTGGSSGSSGSGCAALGYSGSSTLSIDVMEDTYQDSGGLFFAVAALQSRVIEGSDDVTVTFSDLPIGVTGSATPNPVTVSSSSPTPFTMNFNIDTDAIDVGTYQSHVVAQRSGCTDVEFDVTVEVFDGSAVD